MIKGLAITPPVIGRISIGRIVEKNGKRLPEKDDQFTITTQIQTREGWLPHPLDEALRQEGQGKKLRSIPVTLRNRLNLQSADGGLSSSNKAGKALLAWTIAYLRYY